MSAAYWPRDSDSAGRVTSVAVPGLGHGKQDDKDFQTIFSDFIVIFVCTKELNVKNESECELKQCNHCEWNDPRYKKCP